MQVVCALAQRLFEIAGRNIQGDWQGFPSQGRVGERNDLNLAMPFLLACHASRTVTYF
jgi:hypothetical protein